MLPPKAFAGIAGVLLLTLFITWLVIYDTYDENEKHALLAEDEIRILDYVQHNFQSHPLSEIIFFDGSKCPEGYEDIYISKHPGTEPSCQCGQDLAGLSKGACSATTQKDCRTFPSLGDGQYVLLRKWLAGSVVCGKRVVTIETNSDGKCPSEKEKKCSPSFCVGNSVDELCPILDIQIEIQNRDQDQANGYERVNFFEGTGTGPDDGLALLVLRGSADNQVDNFVKTVSTGFNGYPCLDRYHKGKRNLGADNKDVDFKIDHPENYNGCGVFGSDNDASTPIHIQSEVNLLANNGFWVEFLLPVGFRNAVAANSDVYSLYARQALINDPKNSACNKFDFKEAQTDVQKRRFAIIEKFDESFLVFKIAGPICLILIILTFVMGDKPAGKILAVLVTINLLIISIWWICISYQIDDIQEQDTHFETFYNKNCITYNSYKKFFEMANTRIQHHLDYYDKEENGLITIGYIVAILSLLGFACLAAKQNSRSKLSESTAKDPLYKQANNRDY